MKRAVFPKLPHGRISHDNLQKEWSAVIEPLKFGGFTLALAYQSCYHIQNPKYISYFRFEREWGSILFHYPMKESLDKLEKKMLEKMLTLALGQNLSQLGQECLIAPKRKKHSTESLLHRQ